MGITSFAAGRSCGFTIIRDFWMAWFTARACVGLSVNALVRIEALLNGSFKSSIVSVTGTRVAVLDPCSKEYLLSMSFRRRARSASKYNRLSFSHAGKCLDRHVLLDVQVFSNEMAVFLREFDAGAFSVGSFFLGRTLVSWLVSPCPVLTFIYVCCSLR